MARLALILMLLVAGSASAADPKPSKPVTTYFEIEQLHAPCCAVMLKYSLTNITGVATADIFVSNRVVRVVHNPRKGIQKEFRAAFQEGAIGAERVKKVSKEKLK